MFVKDVFKSVTKAFSRWLRPSKPSTRALSLLPLHLSPYKKRPQLPDLKRKLVALFFRINSAGKALPSLLVPSRQRPETEGLRDVCTAYLVSEEVKGAQSVLYPFYLALWDEPVYYQCNMLVLVM